MRKGGEEEEKGREVKRKVGRKGDREGGGGKVGGGIMYKYLPNTLVPYSHTVKCTHIRISTRRSECLTANVLFTVMQ